MVLITILLFSFWVLLSGKLDPVHLLFGFGSALVIVACHREMISRYSKSQSLSDQLSEGVRLVKYCAWLLWRIVLAAIHVTKLILSPKLPIQPKLVIHKSPLKTDFARVLFANSITLTPGTITVDLKDNQYTIHALDQDSCGDIDSGAMEKAIAEAVKEGK